MSQAIGSPGGLARNILDQLTGAAF